MASITFKDSSNGGHADGWKIPVFRGAQSGHQEWTRDVLVFLRMKNLDDFLTKEEKRSIFPSSSKVDSDDNDESK